MVTMGLRGAWIAQRNAAGNTFCALAILPLSLRGIRRPADLASRFDDDPKLGERGRSSQAYLRTQAYLQTSEAFQRAPCEQDSFYIHHNTFVRAPLVTQAREYRTVASRTQST